MKLIKIEARVEGKILPTDAYVVMGRHYDYPNEINGWHLLLNFPFLKKNVPDYLDPRTFTQRAATCYWRFSMMLRKVKGLGKYRLMHCQVWDSE